MRIISENNNNLESIQVGRGGKLINDIHYTYNDRNSLIGANDAITGESHSYTYDNYDRITSWNYANAGGYSDSKSYQYDDQNNLTYKTGTGYMSYNAKNQLTSRSNDGFNYIYEYDAMGNMLSGDNRAYDYTSFNKVKKLQTKTSVESILLLDVESTNQSKYFRFHLGELELLLGRRIGDGEKLMVTNTRTNKQGVVVLHRDFYSDESTSQPANPHDYGHGYWEEGASNGDWQNEDSLGIEYTNEYTHSKEFAYDAGNSRLIKKESSTNPEVYETTTYYINKSYEIIHTRDKANNQITIHRRHIYANGKLVTTYDKTLINGEKTLDQAAYMHTDYLGNIVSVTGNDGEVQLRQASTPFGERISQGLEINTSEKTNTSQPHFHQDNIKGFTGHEQLSSQGLVHMNARLYDPVLGRILQSDTMIPDTRDLLAYNRYIYVKNNPLKYTDPTGHFGMIVAGFVLLTISATTDDPDVAMVTGIAGALLLGGGLGEAGWTAFQSGGAVGFTQGYLNTGELGEAAKQGAISGVSAQLTYEIAHGGENGTSNFGSGTQVFLQGMVGGTASHLRGGRFQDGFMGAVVSKGVDLGLKGQNLNMYQEGSITVIAGGLSSQAAGGSFEDGAIQAGMVFLYNRNAGKLRQEQRKKQRQKYHERMRAGVRDGHLTLREANYHYRNGNGESVTVNGRILEVEMVTDKVGVVKGKDWFVHGNVIVKNGEIQSGDYNFDIKPWSSSTFIRNVLTISGHIFAGERNSFTIHYCYKESC